MKKGINGAKAISDIDEKYIIEALPQDKISVRVFPWKYIALASCLVLVICIGTAAVLFKSGLFGSESTASSATDASSTADPQWEKKIVTHDSSSHTDIAKEKTWEEKSLPERFSTIEKNFTYTGGIVPKDKVNLSHEDGIISPFGEEFTIDPLTGIKYRESMTVYAIKDINKDYARAVRFKSEKDEIYYAYVNTDNNPETLKAFAEALSLENNISFGSAYYEQSDGKTIEFEGLDKKNVLDILFSDSEKSTAISDPDKLLSKNGFKKRISISTSVEILGYKNITISLSDDGYLFTNILSTAKIFNIGKDKVQRLKNYLRSSCKGYELVYDNETDSDSEQDNGGSGFGSDSSKAV